MRRIAAQMRVKRNVNAALKVLRAECLLSLTHEAWFHRHDGRVDARHRPVMPHPGNVILNLGQSRCVRQGAARRDQSPDPECRFHTNPYHPNPPNYLL
jgi:hypothetical protein